MLQFEPSWRFTSPGPIPLPVVHTFYDFIEKIAGQGDTWSIVEKFKHYFSGAIGRSSDLSRVWTDLNRSIDYSAQNAPLFIEAFYKGWSDCQASGLGVPDISLINGILGEHKAGYEIRPPYLVASTDYSPIPVPQKAPSLAAQAQRLIEDALAEAERFLSEGKGRRACRKPCLKPQQAPDEPRFQVLLTA